MKQLIAVLCILNALNLAAMHAAPIEKKKPFTSVELRTLSEQQVASIEALCEVEAGLFGVTSAPVNLALCCADCALAQTITDD